MKNFIVFIPKLVFIKHSPILCFLFTALLIEVYGEGYDEPIRFHKSIHVNQSEYIIVCAENLVLPDCHFNNSSLKKL